MTHHGVFARELPSGCNHLLSKTNSGRARTHIATTPRLPIEHELPLDEEQDAAENDYAPAPRTRFPPAPS